MHTISVPSVLLEIDTLARTGSGILVVYPFLNSPTIPLLNNGQCHIVSFKFPGSDAAHRFWTDVSQPIYCGSPLELPTSLPRHDSFPIFPTLLTFPKSAPQPQSIGRCLRPHPTASTRRSSSLAQTLVTKSLPGLLEAARMLGSAFYKCVKREVSSSVQLVVLIAPTA